METKLFGVIITALLALNTCQVSKFNEKTQQIENERELNFNLYKSISDAIDSSKPRNIRAARVLVENLASENLKDGFLAVLDSSEDDIYQIEESSTKIKTTLPTNNSKTSDFKSRNWDYDIFWCSRSGAAAESLADSIRRDLITDGAEGRIRSRVLPEAIRQEKYDGLASYEIKFDSSDNYDERLQAQSLKGFIHKKTNRDFKLKNNNSGITEWYISVFICPQKQ